MEICGPKAVDGLWTWVFPSFEGCFRIYSHNNYLELLFGCGIIGTALYYLGYIYVLFGHIKLYLKKQIDSKPYIAIIIVQIFLEYAYVSYFERTNILFIILCWAKLELLKNEMKKGVENNEQAKAVAEKSI